MRYLGCCHGNTDVDIVSVEDVSSINHCGQEMGVVNNTDVVVSGCGLLGYRVHVPALTMGWSWRAWQAALTKGDMNPSFTPCWRWKVSFHCCRISITLLHRREGMICASVYMHRREGMTC